MTKGLKALENIKREAGTPYFSTLYDIDMWKEDFETVEKSLKALEIIKNRKVDVGLLLDCKTELEYVNRCCNRYWFNDKCDWRRMTQDEFDLLLEMLR